MHMECVGEEYVPLLYEALQYQSTALPMTCGSAILYIYQLGPAVQPSVNVVAVYIDSTYVVATQGYLYCCGLDPWGAVCQHSSLVPRCPNCTREKRGSLVKLITCMMSGGTDFHIWVHVCSGL